MALGVSGTASSALLMENPLDPSYYNIIHMPRVDMTNIFLTYTAKGSNFAGASTTASTFSLVNQTGSATSFHGAFTMSASITSTGTFSSGSFSFKSSDSMFGFGKTCSHGTCTANTGTVFAGKLTSFGWSESKGMLEFGTGSFSGWACTKGWCTKAERMWFNNNAGNTLGLVDCMNRVKNWSMTARGTSVIPVPAAAWLFGSGLIGMLGVARRKRSN